VDPRALADEFIAAFQEDMGRLGVRRADVEPRVTEHLAEIVDVAKAIQAAGLAYQAGDTLYFAVRRHPAYGKLSKRKLDDLQSGARVEVDTDKEDPLDFALWKGAKPGEPSWPSPWGDGRPGWHIECSAMSAKHLGTTFDIHGGGMDLVFPHHENEIAQSEAAFHAPFARFWMHNGFVNLNQEKMSKSTGNFFTLRELFKVAEPEAIRLFLLSVQYRHPINFKVEPGEGDTARFPDLEEAVARLDYLYDTRLRLEDHLGDAPAEPVAADVMPEVTAAVAAFGEAMDDDFNTASALAPLAELFKLANRLLEDPKTAPKNVRRATLLALRRDLTALTGVLGLWMEPAAAYLARRREAQARARGIDPAWVDAQITARAEARKAKDFARADGLRDELAAKGVELMDGPKGTRWRIVVQASEA
jgi:cysteinyl-tRNA synthetase